MIQRQVILTAKETIGPAWWRLRLAAPDLSRPPQPGQYFLLRCGDLSVCYLRRPLFPASVEADGFTLLLRPDPDPGLAWLLAQPLQTPVDVIGPLGSGFPPLDHTRALLLTGDTYHIGPLLGLTAQAVEAGVAVTLALGGRRATHLYPVTALPPAVEFQAATVDGSLGHRGPVTDLLPDLLPWADTVCAVGSTALYRTLRQQVAEVRLGLDRGFAFGLLSDVSLACGVGACLACTLETSDGLKRACVDGPVFDLATL